MPRRSKPDALALAIGARIRQLREEAGLTMEKLAYESEFGSKGHLSNIERGLVRPTAHTLKLLADGLGLELADMVTFPDDGGDRARLYDISRYITATGVRTLLHEAHELASRRPRLRAAEDTGRYPRGRRRAGARPAKD